jgi:hypothetical protein
MVPANDFATGHGQQVAVSAGAEVIEVVTYDHTGTADRLSHPRWADALYAAVPGTTDKNFWVRPSFDVGFQKNLSTFNGSLAASGRIVQNVTGALDAASVTGGGIYWHADWGSTAGDPQTDPYTAWIIEHGIGGYFRQFPHVVQIDRFQNVIGTPPNSFQTE